jgi:hypothetical protein
MVLREKRMIMRRRDGMMRKEYLFLSSSVVNKRAAIRQKP